MHPKLVEGVGRYGEPIYAMAKYKRRPAPPLSERKTPSAEDAGARLGKLQPAGSVLTLGKKKKDEGPEGAGSGSEDAGGGAGAGSGGPGKPDKPKDN